MGRKELFSFLSPYFPSAVISLPTPVSLPPCNPLLALQRCSHGEYTRAHIPPPTSSITPKFVGRKWYLAVPQPSARTTKKSNSLRKMARLSSSTNQCLSTPHYFFHSLPTTKAQSKNPFVTQPTPCLPGPKHRRNHIIAPSYHQSNYTCNNPNNKSKIQHTSTNLTAWVGGFGQ